MAEREKSIQEELSHPILLADRVIKSAQEADSFLAISAQLAKQAHKLSHQLRCAARLATAAAASSTTVPSDASPLMYPKTSTAP
ncbi:hypothetical protein ACSBR2_007130 [Camellia fascicularis]